MAFSLARWSSAFLKELPALRALVLIIKAFLGQRSMNEVFSGGLGSYSIVCLAVSFLQMHPKIRRGEIDPSKNLGVLMMEFFELYGCYFNYQEVGISIRDGGSYFSKARRGWQDPNRPHLLSIEDPNDMCALWNMSDLFRLLTFYSAANDVSKGSYGIVKVRTTFAGAFTILTSTAFLHAGLMNSRREGRYTNLRARTAPEDLSILSSILGISQEVRPYLILHYGLPLRFCADDSSSEGDPGGLRVRSATRYARCSTTSNLRLHNRRQTASRSSTFRRSIPRKVDRYGPIRLFGTREVQDTRVMRTKMRMRVGIGCDRRDRPLQSDASLNHTRNT
jgi:DNA polymerase sigma